MKENIFKCKACPNIISSCDPLSEYFFRAADNRNIIVVKIYFNFFGGFSSES